MSKSIVVRKLFKFTWGELWTIVTEENVRYALAAEWFLHFIDGFTRVHLFRYIEGVVIYHEKICWPLVEKEVCTFLIATMQGLFWELGSFYRLDSLPLVFLTDNKVFSMSLDSPGHHTDELAFSRVFVLPWRPLGRWRYMSILRLDGIMICFPRSSRPSWTVRFPHSFQDLTIFP